MITIIMISDTFYATQCNIKGIHKDLAVVMQESQIQSENQSLQVRLI